MKRILFFLTIVFFFCSPIACNAVPNAVSPLESIKTYKDIPGVTEEEISSIENLKANRDKFSYGSNLATEIFILPNGSYSGFTKNFCDLLSELFGISFVPEIYDWDELIGRLDSRSLDFTGELTATEERMQVYAMTLPIAERLLRIYRRADSDNIRTEADINGLKIGFLEGSITADSILKTYTVSFQHVEVDNYNTAARMIESGEIDAFIDEAVSDPVFDGFDFIRSAIIFPMMHEPVSMTTANPALVPIISTINKYIAAGGVDKLYELYKEGDFEYAKYKLNKSFTSAERAYIDDLKTRGEPVGVAFSRDSYPVDFYNEKDKEYEGIAVDVLKEISRLTDIEFKAAAAKDDAWPDILEKLRAGDIKMSAHLLYSKERRDYFLWGAVPYSRSYYAILSKSDYPNLASYQVMRATVGIAKQSGYEDIYHELFPNNTNVKLYDTLEECLDALENGDVDLLMASEHMLLTHTNYHEKSGFKINIKLNVPMDSYFGFNRDEDILCSIINKAQQYVPTETIEIDWTGRVFDYGKKLAEQRNFFLSVFVCVLLMILIVTAFLLVRNIKLGTALQEMANNDALTGIFNRRHFMELGLMHIERSLRMKTESFIIIYDLDHFKNVNDHYGHLAGDKVLIEIAQRVKKAIRPYDLFGRYGGEEFILLVHDTDKQNVIYVAERLRTDVCKEPVEFEGLKIPISASFGIAYAAPINDMHTATKHADEALYRAKDQGRNRVVFYEDEDTQTVKDAS